MEIKEELKDSIYNYTGGILGYIYVSRINTEVYYNYVCLGCSEGSTNRIVIYQIKKNNLSCRRYIKLLVNKYINETDHSLLVELEIICLAFLRRFEGAEMI